MRSTRRIRLLLICPLMGTRVQAFEASAPCSFCPNGEAITEPDKEVSLPEFSFQGTCETVDSLVGTLLSADDKECKQLQEISPYCGCPSTIPNPCSLCPDGRNVPFPELEIPWLDGAFHGISPTCSLVEAFLANQSADAQVCELSQVLIASYCGCPALPNRCEICPGEPTLQDEYKDKVLPFLAIDELGFTGTCETLYLAQYQLSADQDWCGNGKLVAFYCGCNDGVLGYYGTSTTQEQAAVVWVARAVGIMSLIASSIILWNIVRDVQKRSSVYHQMMILVAIFDSITSLVWIVGPAAIEETNPSTGLSWGIYGTQGSTDSCTASGFFYQLGITSVFMNVALTVYFLLVVVHGFRETRLKKIRVWLFVPPLVLGFGLAFAVIPHVQESWLLCHADTYPLPKNLWSLLLFLAAPALLSCAIILILLLVIYIKVRRQLRQHSPASSSCFACCKRGDVARETNSPAQKNRKWLEAEVFWQCVWYAAAFSFTWPIMVVGQFNGGDIDSLPYWFWIITSIVGPLQGTNNALCYFRHYFFRKRRLAAPPISIRSSEEATPLEDIKEESPSLFVRMGRWSGLVSGDEVPTSSVWEEAYDPVVELARCNDDDRASFDATVVNRNSQESGEAFLEECGPNRDGPLEPLPEEDGIFHADTLQRSRQDSGSDQRGSSH